MQAIKEEDYSLIVPNINRFDLENIDSQYKDLYLYLTTLYREYFIKYLIKNTKLKEYDDKISNSNLPFIKINNEEKDFYQLYNDDSLNYYYLRNNININRLSDTEKEELIDIANDKQSINNNLEKFIIKTFKNVIRETDDNIKINYGPTSNKFFATDGSLIIGIRYDEFALANKTDEEWEENNDQEDIFLLANNSLLEKNIEDSLNIECKVIKYNEFSIKKKLINRKTKS